MLPARRLHRAAPGRAGTRPVTEDYSGTHDVGVRTLARRAAGQLRAAALEAATCIQLGQFDQAADKLAEVERHRELALSRVEELRRRAELVTAAPPSAGVTAIYPDL